MNPRTTPLFKQCKETCKEITEEDEAVFDPNSPLYMNLFTFIQTHNKESALITNENLAQVYKPTLMKLKSESVKRLPGDPLVPPVQIQLVSDVQSAAQKTIDCNSSFIYVHTTLDFEPERREQEIGKLDQDISSIFDSLPINGMMSFSVVATGKVVPV